MEGEVVVAFSLDRQGALLDARVVQSSGEPALDEAALELLSDAAPFPSLPDELGTDRYTVELPIAYTLR